VLPSRDLFTIVQRPNTESMSRAVIFTRETPASGAPPLQGWFSVYVPTMGKSSSPSTGVASGAMTTTLINPAAILSTNTPFHANIERPFPTVLDAGRAANGQCRGVVAAALKLS
jgi:hypothetical protein